jgi:hypothetical protein
LVASSHFYAWTLSCFCFRLMVHATPLTAELMKLGLDRMEVFAMQLGGYWAYLKLSEDRELQGCTRLLTNLVFVCHFFFFSFSSPIPCDDRIYVFGDWRTPLSRRETHSPNSPVHPERGGLKVL